MSDMMNDFVFQLAVVFMPGLVWAVIVDELTTNPGKTSPFRTGLRAFGFGIASYFAYFIIDYLVWHFRWHMVPPVLDKFTTIDASLLKVLRPIDVVYASGTGATLAVVWSTAANRKWFHRMMRFARVTRKFGDEDVWDYLFNLGSPRVEFASVRDIERGITYEGYVGAFSEGGKIRELLLLKAAVYETASGERQYEMPLIYLARKPDELHIEFPVRPRDAKLPRWMRRMRLFLKRIRHKRKPDDGHRARESADGNGGTGLQSATTADVTKGIISGTAADPSRGAPAVVSFPQVDMSED